MPPKGKRASAAEKAKDVSETEDPLQAVVLADSFETRFSPFTKEKPRCLLRLANTPLIEYTLEFLASSGVEEVYIYCGAHTDQIEAYFQDSPWTKRSSPFTLTTLRSPSRSIGDAMRDLDKRGILANDFLVVYGDVVCNISIEPALLEHRTRRTKDKNAIMTMLLREGTRDTHNGATLSPIFVTDPSKKRCLQYDQMSMGADGGPHSLLLDEDVLLHSGADEIEVRHDLIDCGIDICTPDVLALWSDNFDYEAPRKGFLHSVLKDYELNGKTIHTYIEKKGYANRVRDLRSYDRISKDVLARWTWPMCPDGNFGDSAGCRMYTGAVFKEEGVKVAKTAVLSKKSLVGRGSTIGARTRIEGSTIGRNCRIGEDCDISGSYIWDGVSVGDRTTIRRAIIADGAIVESNCSIQPGTSISFGVHLPSGTTTRERQRLVRSSLRRSGKIPTSPSSSADSQPLDYSPSSSEDESAAAGLYPQSLSRNQSSDSISTLYSSRSSSPDPSHHRTLSTTSATSDPSSGDATTDAASSADFHKEATSSILDSLVRGHDPSTIQIELQAQRMAANASEHAVRKAVVAAFVAFILQRRADTTVKQILEANGDLIRRVVFDYDDAVAVAGAEPGKPDQVDLLMLAQRELVSNKDAPAVMLSLCNGLYGCDLVEPEGLVAWWTDERGTATEALRSVRSHPNMSKLIEIVGDSDDEDEEESEDESDDD